MEEEEYGVFECVAEGVGVCVCMHKGVHSSVISEERKAISEAWVVEAP